MDGIGHSTVNAENDGEKNRTDSSKGGIKRRGLLEKEVKDVSTGHLMETDCCESSFLFGIQSTSGRDGQQWNTPASSWRNCPIWHVPLT